MASSGFQFTMLGFSPKQWLPLVSGLYFYWLFFFFITNHLFLYISMPGDFFFLNWFWTSSAEEQHRVVLSFAQGRLGRQSAVSRRGGRHSELSLVGDSDQGFTGVRK